MGVKVNAGNLNVDISGDGVKVDTGDVKVKTDGSGAKVDAGDVKVDTTTGTVPKVSIPSVPSY